MILDNAKQENMFYKYLEKEIEPIIWGRNRERAYRAAVYLEDDTYISCVLFRNSYAKADRAIQQFEEMRTKPNNDTRINYRSMVRAFTTGNNIIASNIISRIEKSPYAISTACYNKLASILEEEYGGIAFLGKMDDGKKFDFFIGTDIEFIDMPQGYNASQLVEITPHSRREDFKDLQEKFYFNCFLDCIH